MYIGVYVVKMSVCLCYTCLADVTVHFSGQGKADGRVCACVCVCVSVANTSSGKKHQLFRSFEANNVKRHVVCWRKEISLFLNVRDSYKCNKRKAGVAFRHDVILVSSCCNSVTGPPLACPTALQLAVSVRFLSIHADRRTRRALFMGKPLKSRRKRWQRWRRRSTRPTASHALHTYCGSRDTAYSPGAVCGGRAAFVRR